MSPSPSWPSRRPVPARLLALVASGLLVPLQGPPDAGWLPPSSSADPSSVVRSYDPPATPWGAGHRGVDWASPDGQVRAPAAGTVHFAGDVAGRPVITLAHADGKLSSLEPVVARQGLAVGDRVGAGDLLGTVDTEVDHCPERCVHWGVRIADGWIVDGTAWDRYVDPLVMLGWSGPSVLWPLEGDPPG
jgi:murein DD-endopeptidase MepM/ murein hydrolase activator NlpD